MNCVSHTLIRRKHESIDETTAIVSEMQERLRYYYTIERLKSAAFIFLRYFHG